MANYKELQLKEDSQGPDFDWDNPPEQPSGGFAPAIYPDSYEFELPKTLENSWVTVDITQGDLAGKQRVAAQFDRDNQLVGLRSGSGQHDGESFFGRLSNVERNKAKKGEPPKWSSDLLNLLVFGFGSKDRPKSNKEWIEAVNSLAGKRFVADVEWSAFCNRKKPIYIYTADGSVVEDPGELNMDTGETTKRVGCGKNYYMRDIPKDQAGAYSERFSCACGAALRAFPQLVRFRPATS